MLLETCDVTVWRHWLICCAYTRLVCRRRDVVYRTKWRRCCRDASPGWPVSAFVALHSVIGRHLPQYPSMHLYWVCISEKKSRVIFAKARNGLHVVLMHVSLTSDTASWNVEGPYVDCVDDAPVLFSAGSNWSICNSATAYFITLAHCK